jgi:hypothetical protein
MAACIGVETGAYNVAEVTGRLSLNVAHMICATFPVSLDWLYYGREDLLPVWLHRALSPPLDPMRQGRPRKRAPRLQSAEPDLDTGGNDDWPPPY